MWFSQQSQNEYRIACFILVSPLFCDCEKEEEHFINYINCIIDERIKLNCNNTIYIMFWLMIPSKTFDFTEYYDDHVHTKVTTDGK